jgi:hypothetical protein
MALLFSRGISTPSLKAQGEQRRSSLFNIPRDNPGYSRGALVTSFEGRPIKVEGNPRHPASLGSTDVFAQAETPALYDPDRSQTVRVAGEISDWPAFEQALRDHIAGRAAGRGAGLRLLSGRVSSATCSTRSKA